MLRNTDLNNCICKEEKNEAVVMYGTFSGDLSYLVTVWSFEENSHEKN
jgi:hypothetical protein